MTENMFSIETPAPGAQAKALYTSEASRVSRYYMKNLYATCMLGFKLTSH